MINLMNNSRVAKPSSGPYDPAFRERLYSTTRLELSLIWFARYRKSFSLDFVIFQEGYKKI